MLNCDICKESFNPSDKLCKHLICKLIKYDRRASEERKQDIAWRQGLHKAKKLMLHTFTNT